jgi:hypothetical protein
VCRIINVGWTECYPTLCETKEDQIKFNFAVGGYSARIIFIMNCLFIGNFLHRRGIETGPCRLGTRQLGWVSANLLTLLMEPPCTTLTQILKERKNTHTHNTHTHTPTRKEILNLREILLATVEVATELYYGTREKQLTHKDPRCMSTQWLRTASLWTARVAQTACYAMWHRAWDRFFRTTLFARTRFIENSSVGCSEKVNLERVWNLLSSNPYNYVSC